MILAFISGCESGFENHGYNVEHNQAIYISEGESIRLTPQYIPEGPLTWVSISVQYVTVDSNGVVAGIAPGGSYIRARTKIKGTVYQEEFLVYVSTDHGEIHGLSIETNMIPDQNAAGYLMALNEEYSVTAALEAENPDMEKSEKFTWESSAPSVASIKIGSKDNDKNVLITAHDIGEADITVSYQDAVLVIRVRVYQPEALELSITDAMDKGMISVSAKGSTIEKSFIHLKNLTDSIISITISKGIWLSSTDENYQNMLILNESSVTVPPFGEANHGVATACMNLFRDVPGSNVSFTIRSLEGSDTLLLLLDAFEREKYSNAVKQAAVWIITDGLNENNLYRAVSGISQADYELARTITDQIIDHP
jgi:hypothetical protein